MWDMLWTECARTGFCPSSKVFPSSSLFYYGSPLSYIISGMTSTAVRGRSSEAYSHLIDINDDNKKKI
jgi:hypothetical protein